MPDLTWTKDRPTSPGWYWFEADQSTAPELREGGRSVCLVLDHQGELYARLGPTSDRKCRNGWHRPSDLGGQWAGPIPEPTDSG